MLKITLYFLVLSALLLPVAELRASEQLRGTCEEQKTLEKYKKYMNTDPNKACTYISGEKVDTREGRACQMAWHKMHEKANAYLKEQRAFCGPVLALFKQCEGKNPGSSGSPETQREFFQCLANAHTKAEAGEKKLSKLLDDAVKATQEYEEKNKRVADEVLTKLKTSTNNDPIVTVEQLKEASAAKDAIDSFSSISKDDSQNHARMAIHHQQGKEENLRRMQALTSNKPGPNNKPTGTDNSNISKNSLEQNNQQGAGTQQGQQQASSGMSGLPAAAAGAAGAAGGAASGGGSGSSGSGSTNPYMSSSAPYSGSEINPTNTSYHSGTNSQQAGSTTNDSGGSSDSGNNFSLQTDSDPDTSGTGLSLGRSSSDDNVVAGAASSTYSSGPAGRKVSSSGGGAFSSDGFMDNSGSGSTANASKKGSSKSASSADIFGGDLSLGGDLGGPLMEFSSAETNPDILGVGNIQADNNTLTEDEQSALDLLENDSADNKQASSAIGSENSEGLFARIRAAHTRSIQRGLIILSVSKKTR